MQAHGLLKKRGHLESISSSSPSLHSFGVQSCNRPKELSFSART